jgi:hypothetical protein
MQVKERTRKTLWLQLCFMQDVLDRSVSPWLRNSPILKSISKAIKTLDFLSTTCSQQNLILNHNHSQLLCCDIIIAVIKDPNDWHQQMSFDSDESSERLRCLMSSRLRCSDILRLCYAIFLLFLFRDYEDSWKYCQWLLFCILMETLVVGEGRGMSFGLCVGNGDLEKSLCFKLWCRREALLLLVI